MKPSGFFKKETIKRFKEQESIDNCVIEAKDLLSRLAQLERLDPAIQDWDDVAALLFTTRAHLKMALDHALHLQGWKKFGGKEQLTEVHHAEGS